MTTNNTNNTNNTNSGRVEFGRFFVLEKDGARRYKVYFNTIDDARRFIARENKYTPNISRTIHSTAAELNGRIIELETEIKYLRGLLARV